ncbi:CAAX amino terminal protease self- immunity [Clostridium puniceum]|uniref:CAAX amino terminal protease self-immunity n=1 Tax=Clostridium puniceum TaxID=29367 RepID=A0A1S8TLC0_9CLOT|nr:CPBP family intramembrane glutamic endopeptidase [Clostridium puniceum]OOM78511.1 CAAX amino terminal protease self- immunity [Clostridium puniceum]
MINDFQQEVMSRKFSLKEDLKKTGGNCTRMLLILAILTYAIGYLFKLIIKTKGVILGIDIITNLEANIILGISKDAYSFWIGYLPCIIGDVVAIIIAIKTTKIRLRDDVFTSNKAPKMFVLLGTISCIGTGMISSMIYLIYSTIIKHYGIIIPQPDFTLPNQREYLVLFLTYVCLLGPILEEIIFRGFILKSMQKYGNLTAIIVSSILFSMFHLNLVQFINPVLMGTVLAFITIKSKSIFPSIIAHIFNNTIAFTATGISSLKMPVVEGLFGMVYLLVGVSALTLFVILYGQEFLQTLKEDTRILKTHEKIKYSFSGRWSLGYIAFYIIFVIGVMAATNLMK